MILSFTGVTSAVPGTGGNFIQTPGEYDITITDVEVFTSASQNQGIKIIFKNNQEEQGNTCLWLTEKSIPYTKYTIESILGAQINDLDINQLVGKTAKVVCSFKKEESFDQLTGVSLGLKDAKYPDFEFVYNNPAAVAPAVAPVVGVVQQPVAPVVPNTPIGLNPAAVAPAVAPVVGTSELPF